MFVAEHFFSWDARENKAIERLCAALDDVVATGVPVAVECFPASLTNREFVAIAVDLCKRAEVNVAILGNGTKNALTLVPLLAAPAVRRRSGPRGKAFGPLARAGAAADSFS
ncbi:MAG: hypothetical protein ACJ757_01795 [Gaiellaceae bacterium]